MNGFDNGNKLPFMSPFFKTTVYNYAKCENTRKLFLSIGNVHKQNNIFFSYLESYYNYLTVWLHFLQFVLSFKMLKVSQIMHDNQHRTKRFKLGHHLPMYSFLLIF